ncbi:MAG: class I tRNA ligase family protein [Candidatus Shapirobacteria bacterium]
MDFREIEAKWAKFWEEHPELSSGVDNDTKRKKFYVLVEFPYPSGSGLHIGHAFSFTGADVQARFRRMQGYNVMFPMGWDSFGLPTENYAIKTKRKPQEIAKENEQAFKKQMKKLAYSFDWNREISTADPNYYKWTQWIFIQLFKKGLAYKKEMPINWCPSCKIGLANEEVIDGKCERCRAEVSRRNIAQWIVKITDYADKLIEGLGKTNFIEKVKQAQINWIGKSEGARIKFKIQNSKFKIKELEIFTTRPDTLFGATFMVVAPEHKLVLQILNPSFDSPLDRGESKTAPALLREGVGEGFDLDAVKNYVINAGKKSEMERTELNKEKTGVFSGLYAINPATGKEIPIWISDFVLAAYGTGAIMAVPAHDERDFAFAKKFGLPIVPVVMPDNGHDFEKEAYTDVNVGKIVNSPPINGMTPAEAFKKMIEWLVEYKIGEKTNSYHLRDWIFSRQHYWGEPIPMVWCEKCGWMPIPEEELPVKLPEVEHYEPTDTGESPLSQMTDWVKTKCPVCGGEARRETDTMPNWAGSDWYFVRYLDPRNEKEIAGMEEMKYWMPVDLYIGGDEHNTLHLLYSRFIYKFLYDLGVVPTKEPYFRRMSHGVILGPDGQRMSKSRGNVVVPDEIVEKYGVDVVRMYLMFMGPFEGTMAWNEKTLLGVKRFLEKLERLVYKHIKSNCASNKWAQVIINKKIDGITRNIESFGYNTAIAKMMEMINELQIKNYELRIEDIKKIIKLAAPMVPYLAEELWNKVKDNNDSKSVHQAEWPKAEEKYLVEEEITIAVAVNGKVREQLVVKSEDAENREEVIKKAKGLLGMKKWLEGKEVMKEFYVPGKMINLVLK